MTVAVGWVGGGSPVDTSSLETRTNDDSKKRTAQPMASFGGGSEIEPMKRGCERTSRPTRGQTDIIGGQQK